MKKNLIIIAALAKNGVIGNKGKIPWNIPEDMRRFRNFTFGSPIIMGRKTYDSIIERNGHPLGNGRTSIVLSRKPQKLEKGVEVYDNIEEAIKRGKELSLRTYVIGGQEIYEQTIDLADEMDLTKIMYEPPPEGDAIFPEIKEDKWTRISHIYESGLNLYWDFYKRKE